MSSDTELRDAFKALKREHEAMNLTLTQIVIATQDSINEIRREIVMSRKISSQIESRVEKFGMKKTDELEKVKDSAIKKLNDLIVMCDLKIKNGRIEQ